jgi:hypothetical protein
VDDLNQARRCLSDFANALNTLPSPPAIDRVQVVAYSTLEAFTSHFPNQALPSDFALIQQTQIIATREPDRFFKQRRMALSKLAAHLVR